MEIEKEKANGILPDKERSGEQNLPSKAKESAGKWKGNAVGNFFYLMKKEQSKFQRVKRY